MKKIIKISLFFLLNIFLFSNANSYDANFAKDLFENKLNSSEATNIISKNDNDFISFGDVLYLASISSCKDCSLPNGNVEIINANKENAFSVNSVYKNYQVCLASGRTKNYVTNANYSSNISYKEALKIFMLESGKISQNDVQNIISKIENGFDYPNIGIDVLPKNLDNSVNEFYPYFYLALNVDYSGEKFLNISTAAIGADKFMTKNELYELSYKFYKINLCEGKGENFTKNIKAEILLGTCENLETGICENKLQITQNFSLGTNYDFYISDSSQNGKWIFYNNSTGNFFVREGNYVDNFSFTENGIWKIIYKNYSSGISDEFVIGIGNGNFNYKINYLSEDFTIPYLGQYVVSSNNSSFLVNWNIGNKNSSEINFSHIFDTSGNKKINAKIQFGSQNINLTLNQFLEDLKSCTKDFDNDGITDCYDFCPTIKGTILNNGCPQVEQTCNTNADCSTGFICENANSLMSNGNSYCKPKIDFEIPFGKCSFSEYTPTVLAEVTCNSCPCASKVDFKRTFRQCDIIFPAILSNDSGRILTEGKVFNISR